MDTCPEVGGSSGASTQILQSSVRALKNHVPAQRLYKPPPAKQDGHRRRNAQRHGGQRRGQELHGAARARHGQEVLGVLGLLRSGFLEGVGVSGEDIRIMGTGSSGIGQRTLNAARPTTTPAAKKAKAMISQRTPHTAHVRGSSAGCVRKGRKNTMGGRRYLARGSIHRSRRRKRRPSR